jgi:hypothetical protein
MVIGIIKLYDNAIFSLALTQYEDGTPAIVVLEGDDLYAKLSVNIPEQKLEENEFCIKTWSENEELARIVMESGLFEDTGNRVTCGFTEAQIWRLKEPTNKQVQDAVLVQDACNPSGVLNSFIKLWKSENLTPNNQLAVMYANKLASFARQYDTNEPTKSWAETLEMAESVLEEMTGLHTEAKASLPSFVALCKELSAWTLCHESNVMIDAMKRMGYQKYWEGNYEALASYMMRYCLATNA